MTGQARLAGGGGTGTSGERGASAGRTADERGPEPTLPRAGRVLGVDLGASRIGVAVSDGGQRLATALTVVTRGGDPDRDRTVLVRLIEDEDAVGLVVGLPRSLDGSIGPAAQAALTEVAALKEVLAVPVETHDERFTTVTATRLLRAGGTRGRAHRRVVDQVAAAVMLQSWLDRRAAR